MKFTILALLGLVTVQATELPASDDLVERYHINRRAEDELAEKNKRSSRKHRRADEDELLEKRRRHRRTDENDLVERRKGCSSK